MDKYPNFKWWRQLVYVPICNGLLSSPSFVFSFSIIKHCQTSLTCLLLPLQHYTNKPHLTHTTPQLTRPLLINQLTVTCSGEIFGLVVTDMQIHHDQIFRGLRTVVSRAVSVAPLGQLSWPLSHSATHFLNLSRLGIVGAHLMTAPSLC